MRVQDHSGGEPLEQTYRVDAVCANCGWQGEIRLPKGTRAPTSVSNARVCKHCECQTVLRRLP